jgi:hypothetical protein
LRDAHLLPDQIGDIQSAPAETAKNSIPKVVQQSAYAIAVKRLNLDQVVRIGHALQSMGAGTKMMGLEVTQSAGQTHYYDAIYKVVQFSLPEISLEVGGPPDLKKRAAPKNGRPKPRGDEDVGE